MPHPSRSRWFSVIWCGFVLAALLGLPGWLSASGSLWTLPAGDLVLAVGFVASFVAGVALSARSPLRTAVRARLLALVPVLAVPATTFLILLLVPDATYSRLFLLSGCLVVTGGLVLPMATPMSDRAVLTVMVGASGACGWLLLTPSGSRAASALASHLPGSMGRLLRGTSPNRPTVTTRYVYSSRYTLAVTYYRHWLPPAQLPEVSGGAIHPYPGGQGYLLVRPRGAFYRFSWDGSDSLRLREVAVPAVPLNSSVFEADVDDELGKTYFRVADLLVAGQGDSVRLYATHHYWHHGERCSTVRLSTITVPEIDAADAAALGSVAWRTVFESRPCLPLKFGTRGVPFAGLRIGGNLEFLDADRILMTLGDHEFDGWNSERDLVQDTSSDYGKTLLVDPRSGRVEHFTIGHRNPEGLTVDGRGRIWLTEHGPEGGGRAEPARARWKLRVAAAEPRDAVRRSDLAPAGGARSGRRRSHRVHLTRLRLGSLDRGLGPRRDWRRRIRSVARRPARRFTARRALVANPNRGGSGGLLGGYRDR